MYHTIFFLGILIKFHHINAEEFHNGISKVADINVNNASMKSLKTGMNLGELCPLLNITADECSCSVTASLCELETFVGKIKNNSERHVYARSDQNTMIYVCLTLMASSFGVIGNIVVLLVAYNQQNKLTSYRLHIAELAMTNLVFSILQIINAVPLIWTNKWIYGLQACKVIRTLIEIGTLMTIVFVLIIAVERFFLIVYPVHNNCIERQLKHFFVVGGLVVVVLTIIPYYAGLRIDEKSGRCVQFAKETSNLAMPYSWVVLVLYFLIPGIFITSMYGKTIKHISVHLTYINDAENEELHLRKMKTNRRVVYMTITILFCFLLCTLPTRATFIYMKMNNLNMLRGEAFEMNNELYFVLTFICYITYPFQCTVNPILYSMVDSEWRREFCNLVYKSNSGLRKRSTTKLSTLAGGGGSEEFNKNWVVTSTFQYDGGNTYVKHYTTTIVKIGLDKDNISESSL